MPYINIREADITPVNSFDTIENAVLIFGFDFHRYMSDKVNVKSTELYNGKAYKLYTSVADFLKDIITPLKNYSTGINMNLFNNEFVYRPFRTAYDCLLRGLPVIYVPLDDYIPDNMVISYSTFNPDGSVSSVYKYVEYEWLLAPEISVDAEYWTQGLNIFGYIWTDNDEIAANVEHVNSCLSSDGKLHVAELALFNLLKGDFGKFNDIVPLSDRINMPVTFITTCGYEGLDDEYNVYRDKILSSLGSRLDVLYLYDFRSELTPEYIYAQGKSDSSWIVFDKPQLVNIVYPWGHYNLYCGVNNAHMPGSYGYLMAYATSIKNNFPWLATAGVHRGRIPNIVALDYDIKESYLHRWQGDNYNSDDWTVSLRINPIIDLGTNYGKVIFGNRTCFPENAKEVVFRTFLNVRLLLIYLHKQLFKVSMRHMFEPNDDIVWLSFKQAANSLLDKMVTGRGIQWYKWQRLRPEDSQGNLILGQIKAKLTIRPIEAVESFDITINMTDQEIEVVEGEE